MNCDMCGSEEQLFKTSIEGSELNVCKRCAKHGKIIAPIRVQTGREKKIEAKEAARPKGPKRELIQVIADDFAKRIRSAREKLGLSQEDFARQLNEKTSLIHHLEIGKMEPSLSLARKLERNLKIRLIEQHEEIHAAHKETASDTFTIGDFIKVRKKS